MPIIQAAKKDLRKSARRRAHNLSYINKFKKIRTEIRKFVREKKPAEAKKLLSSFYQVLDKGVKENVFKKNAAARYKSRVTKMIGKK